MRNVFRSSSSNPHLGKLKIEKLTTVRPMVPKRNFMSTRLLSTEVQGKYFSLVKAVLCIELVWDKLRELLECLLLFKNNLELFGVEY